MRTRTAVAALAAVAVLPFTTVAPAQAAQVHYAPTARVAGKICDDHNSARFRVRLDNRRSTGRLAAVGYEVTTISGSGYVHTATRTVPAGQTRRVLIPVEAWQPVRVIVRALDGPVFSRVLALRPAACRFAARIGAVNDHDAAPVVLVNRLHRPRLFTVETSTLTGGMRAWRVRVPATSRRHVMAGIDPAGTRVAVRKGHRTLLNVVRMTG